MGLKEAFHRLRSKDNSFSLHPLVRDLRFVTKSLEKSLEKAPQHEGLFNGIELVSTIFERLGKATGGTITFNRGRRKIFVNGFEDGEYKETRIEASSRGEPKLVLHSHRGQLGEWSLDDVHVYIPEQESITSSRDLNVSVDHTVVVASAFASWGKKLYEQGDDVTKQIYAGYIQANGKSPQRLVKPLVA
jgi:hypothetical protein